MKKGISRKIFKMIGGICVSLLIFGNIAYASDNLVKESSNQYERKFTKATQDKISLIQKLVSKGGISVTNGSYSIISNSTSIINLDVNTKNEVNEAINLFNEGISLGLFEIDNENYIISSNNYEKSHINNTDMIKPMAIELDIDSSLKANESTMLRTLYVNTQSYGSNVGTYETGKFFASKVRSGGDWDYKLLYGPKTLYLCYINDKYVNMTGEAIGNANYGFAGRKVFGADLLRSAAGAYQIYSGTSSPGWYNSYFDDPNDQYWINRGINYSQGGSF